LSIHNHEFTLKHLCWHSITKILRNGPRAHFPFKTLPVPVCIASTRNALPAQEMSAGIAAHGTC
jgi:hypothetical protein